MAHYIFKINSFKITCEGALCVRFVFHDFQSQKKNYNCIHFMHPNSISATLRIVPSRRIFQGVSPITNIFHGKISFPHIILTIYFSTSARLKKNNFLHLFSRVYSKNVQQVRSFLHQLNIIHHYHATLSIVTRRH